MRECPSRDMYPTLAQSLDMRFVMTLLCAAMLAGCRGEADFSGALPTQTLEAEKYRQEITSIDRLLFQARPLGDVGVRSLENVLTGLSNRVGAYSDSKFLKLEGLELKLLAKHAARLSPNGTGKALQNDWMRIRNNLFDDRAWFARSAADLEYAASSEPSPAAVATAQPAGRIFIPVDAEPRRALTGRWRAVSMLANGQARDDHELIGSIWTFDRPRLIVQDGTGHQTIYNFTDESGFLSLMMASGQEGWMKYELGEEGLRLAFFDGLKGKPESFEPQPERSDPMLVVVRLVPAH